MADSDVTLQNLVPAHRNDTTFSLTLFPKNYESTLLTNEISLKELRNVFVLIFFAFLLKMVNI